MLIKTGMHNWTNAHTRSPFTPHVNLTRALKGNILPNGKTDKSGDMFTGKWQKEKKTTKTLHYFAF